MMSKNDMNGQRNTTGLSMPSEMRFTTRARSGVRLEGATMFVPWFPCAACARAIVQVGLSLLVAVRPLGQDAQWDEQFAVSEVLLREGGVEVRLAADA